MIPTPIANDFGEQVAEAERSGLPRASKIGTNWRFSELLDVDPLRGTDSPRYQVWYTASDGSRILITVGDYGTSVRDAIALFEQQEAAMEGLESSLFEFRGSRRSSELGRLDPPPGCAEAAFAEGFERVTAYPVGAIACLDETNQRVLNRGSQRLSWALRV